LKWSRRIEAAGVGSAAGETPPALQASAARPSAPTTAVLRVFIDRLPRVLEARYLQAGTSTELRAETPSEL
jgi:hypothetical protein